MRCVWNDKKSKPKKANNKYNELYCNSKVLSKKYHFCTKNAKLKNNGIKNM
jgi:hypothetical protein